MELGASKFLGRVGSGSRPERPMDRTAGDEGSQEAQQAERGKDRFMNLGMWSAVEWNTDSALRTGRNPFGVVDLFPTIPRVARSEQPWALGRNPFGIGGPPPYGVPGR